MVASLVCASLFQGVPVMGDPLCGNSDASLWCSEQEISQSQQWRGGRQAPEQNIGQYPNADLHEFSTISDAFLDLYNGGVDAVVNDTPVDEYYVENKGKGIAKVVPAQINQEDLGIAVKKGNAELLGQLNAGLKTIKENGKYAEIYRKWFGKEPPAK